LEITQFAIRYDLASWQSKIPFAIQRMRETGLPSFGEKLKQEREKRKITLEQISVSTKIGTRMLQALEEDKFNQLPGGIFNKGFVRAYSRCVGLDEDQTVAEYLLASGDAPPPRTEIAPREDEARENRENEERISRLEAVSDAPARQLPWGLFAAILLLIALALALWSRRQHEHEKQSLHPAPTTSRTPLPAGPSAALSANVTGKVSTIETHASETPTSEANTNEASGSGSPKTVPPVTGSAAAIAATADEFSVVIQAREESWVLITTDGKTAQSELLPAGAERAIRGRKEIIVKTGNAGGVDLRFNGKKLDTGGQFGEVKTVTFGPGGMIPNAPPLPSAP
jgi:cytoskeleton protein RodZ